MTKFAPGNSRAARVSNEQVLEIRRLYHDEGWTQGRLAREFGLNINTIGRMVRGESRQRVPMPTDSPSEIAARMAKLQSLRDAEIRERLAADLAKEPSILVKQAEQDLAEFASPDAVRRFGIDD